MLCLYRFLSCYRIRAKKRRCKKDVFFRLFFSSSSCLSVRAQSLSSNHVHNHLDIYHKSEKCFTLKLMIDALIFNDFL